MTDTIEQHISASPQICERVIASLKMHNGSTVSNLSYFSGYSRIIVIDALEQMERRGAVRHEMANWYVVPSHSPNVGSLVSSATAGNPI